MSVAHKVVLDVTCATANIMQVAFLLNALRTIVTGPSLSYDTVYQDVATTEVLDITNGYVSLAHLESIHSSDALETFRERAGAQPEQID